MVKLKKFLYDNSFLLVVFVWLAIYSLRPWFLGFYHDDWSILVESTNYGGPFSFTRLSWFMTSFTSRPLSGFLYYLFTSVLGKSAFAWQTAQALIVLLVALALRGLVISLTRFLEIKVQWFADVAVSFWLVFPWAMGVTAWPTSSAPLFSVLFFAWGAAQFFDRLDAGKLPGTTTYLLFFLSFLTLEAFYGQYLVLIGLALLTRWSRHFPWRLVTLPLAILTVIQVVFVLWNRLSPRFLPGFTKVFYEQWWQLTFSSWRRLPYLLFKSAGEVELPLKLGIGVLGALFGISLVRTGLKKSTRKQIAFIFGALFLSGTGVLLAILVYSLAGYGIETIGLFSRTTMSLNVWLLLIIALLLGLAEKLLPTSFKKAFGLTLFGLFLCLGLATVMRMQDWAEGWQLEKQILAQAPMAQISQTDPQAAIIFAGPYVHKGIHIFIATWDISAAMNNTYPQLRFKAAAEKWRGGRLFTVQRDWVTSWDGQRLTQGQAPAGEPTLWSLPASQAWLWRYSPYEFTELQAPFVLGPQEPPE